MMWIMAATPHTFTNIIQLKNDGNAVKDDHLFTCIPVLQYNCHIKVPVKNCFISHFMLLNCQSKLKFPLGAV